MNCGGEGTDGVHQWVLVVILWDCDVPFVVLLILEVPGDSVGVEKVWIVEVEFSRADEEADVAEAAEFSLSFGSGFGIFARATCPEKCRYREESESCLFVGGGSVEELSVE